MADYPGGISQSQRRIAQLQEKQQALREKHEKVQKELDAEQTQSEAEQVQPEAEQEQSEAVRMNDPEYRFRFNQKKQAFDFAKFRTEGRRLTKDEIDAKKFQKLKLPKRGRYRGPGLLAGKWKGFRFSWDPDDIGHDGSLKEAKRARIRLQRRLKAHKFKLERTLGWGGHGIASLYSFRRSPDRPVEYVVVKGNIDQDKSKEIDLIREREAQDAYRHALHVVQTVHFKPAPGRKPDAFRTLIFLEYLKRGSLHKAICAAQENEEPFPDRVLWHMFRCLIKSCIAMEYPPSKDHGRPCSRDPDGEIIGDISERIPPDLQALYDQAVQDGTWKDKGSAPGGEGLVHFDIDPQNILIGGFPTAATPDDPHYDFPVLKVGDFGNACKVDAGLLSSSRKMWLLRGQGKQNYIPPEQFTAEWDWVVDNPAEDVFVSEEDIERGILPPAPVEIAGKYCWKMNLYQLALCMVSAITFHLPALPPFPGKMDIIDPQNGVRKKVWSYGAYILENRYKKVDWKLRHLVAWCLCEKPAHRPHMRELLQMVDDYLAEKRWGRDNNDETVDRWLRRNVDVLPPPPKRKHWIDEPVRKWKMPSEG